MAAKVRIELNHDGIRELLSSAPIAAECEKAAQRIAAAAVMGSKSPVRNRQDSAAAAFPMASKRPPTKRALPRLKTRCFLRR